MTERTAESVANLGYHAHIYYDPEKTRGVAERVCAAVGEKFRVELDGFRDEPRGPHPISNVLIVFKADQFKDVVPYLMLNRDGLDVLVHPLTLDAVEDHSSYAIWLGNPVPLKLHTLPHGRGGQLPSGVAPQEPACVAPASRQRFRDENGLVWEDCHAARRENELLTRVGAGTPMGKTMPLYWIPACLLHEIAEPVTIGLDDPGVALGFLHRAVDQVVVIEAGLRAEIRLIDMDRPVAEAFSRRLTSSSASDLLQHQSQTMQVSSSIGTQMWPASIGSPDSERDGRI